MNECILHFNMINDLNKLLKDNNIDYTLHVIGGCSCEGVEVRKHSKRTEIIEIRTLINEYLKPKFLYVVSDEDNPYILRVKSLFDLAKK